MILSVGSTTGFGYQPLIGAGGTAVVSGLEQFLQFLLVIVDLDIELVCRQLM